MTVVDGGIGGSGLVQRVKGILLRPKAEWEVIEAEPTSIQGLYTGYICILAAIPAIAMLIGGLLFGYGVPGLFVVRPSPVSAVVDALVAYLMALVGVAVIALVIDALAPSFGGEKNRTQAFKVVGYSFTPAWVAGILYVIPQLAPIVWLLGLYSLYLLYLGLPRLMKAPQEKAVGYTVVSIVVAVVVMIVISMIVTAVRAATHATGAMSTASADRGTVVIGGRTINVGEMEAAARRMEATAKGEPGGVTAVAPDALKGMLPAALGGFSLKESSAVSAGAAGVGGSSAEGRYESGESVIRLSVVDMAAMGALATLGNALGVQSSRETESGYEKTSVINGRMTTEQYDREARSGKYMVVVGERFAVAAEGEQVEMSQLKGAVNAVSAGRLEGLARR